MKRSTSAPHRHTRRRVFLAAVIPVLIYGGCRQFPTVEPKTDMERQGRDIFRDDTFGDDAYWTDTAKLNDVVQKRIRPLTALGLGLKVDLGRLNLIKFLLHNPFGTNGTRELLRENAVVGVKAQVVNGKIVSIGITCALCHS